MVVRWRHPHSMPDIVLQRHNHLYDSDLVDSRSGIPRMRNRRRLWSRNQNLRRDLQLRVPEQQFAAFGRDIRGRVPQRSIGPDLASQLHDSRARAVVARRLLHNNHPGPEARADNRHDSEWHHSPLRGWSLRLPRYNLHRDADRLNRADRQQYSGRKGERHSYIGAGLEPGARGRRLGLRVRSAEDRLRDAAGAEQARADMGAEHGADLRAEGRLAAEDLVAVFDQGVGGLVVLDVLDDPGVEAGLVALAHVAAQPLDRAGAGAHALDRGDLLLEREDRLDFQR